VHVVLAANRMRWHQTAVERENPEKSIINASVYAIGPAIFRTVLDRSPLASDYDRKSRLWNNIFAGEDACSAAKVKKFANINLLTSISIGRFALGVRRAESESTEVSGPTVSEIRTFGQSLAAESALVQPTLTQSIFSRTHGI
jgi:hypothetical protein